MDERILRGIHDGAALKIVASNLAAAIINKLGTCTGPEAARIYREVLGHLGDRVRTPTT